LDYVALLLARQFFIIQTLAITIKSSESLQYNLFIRNFIFNTYIKLIPTIGTINNSKTIVIVALSIAMAFGIMFAAVAPMQAFAVSSNVDDNNDDVKLLKCKGGSQGFKSSGHKCH
jgi:uncharacterized membrane protein YbaN (DUF454 family)